LSVERAEFRELTAWQVAFDLARLTYRAHGRATQIGGIRPQGANAARRHVSIPSNLAEGAGRSTRKDFSNFVTIARGSLNELQTQVLLSAELGFLSSADVNHLQTVIDRLYALLNGLRNSLNAER
jgi:four helix bundle protein